MVHAIRLKAYGEPDVLAWERVEVGKPAAGQVRIRQTAIGVNFMEVSQRRGRSPIPLTLPGGLGGEAAGVIEELGEGVADLAIGDRVAYAGGGAGKNCDWAKNFDKLDLCGDKFARLCNAIVFLLSCHR